MEMFGFDDYMRKIARKHGIDLNKANIQDAIDHRDERQEQESIKFTKENNKVKRKRMFDSSVVSDPIILSKTFDDFNITDKIQKSEFDKARSIADRILNGEKGNFTFSGTPGAGKTLSAVSILNKIQHSDSSLTCYFASVSMLAQMNKDSIQYPEIKTDFINAERCIKQCDILVLDDLGSETSFQKNIKEASDYQQAMLFRLADYRAENKNKVNIVTTNNTSKELKRIYNGKIYDRLIASNFDNVIKFTSKDCRMF
ncbi:ATP-binding protein [Companilactobacillus zhachilii]|uniref:ATP-binding protein n=1 Tax=Companilactobacillus zhachilii TaxID=2304606 RepID=A0A386PSU8_9LACO|nr:AAA family ATPase [Companilactobacillus zhachilii]AYE37793.1 ATP-binding protein [Companilactobacillus zhachilii]